jgi:hypothetical protein
VCLCASACAFVGAHVSGEHEVAGDTVTRRGSGALSRGHTCSRTGRPLQRGYYDGK